MKEIFGDDYRDEWQQEAQQRWGDTDQWRRIPGTDHEVQCGRLAADQGGH